MKKLGASAAEDLLEIFVRRHETASTLITTNRPTQDWGVFLGDVPAATAILDRFLAHAEIVQMTGKSYRLRHSLEARRRTRSDNQLPPPPRLRVRTHHHTTIATPAWPLLKCSSVAAFERSVTVMGHLGTLRLLGWTARRLGVCGNPANNIGQSHLWNRTARYAARAVAMQESSRRGDPREIATFNRFGENRNSIPRGMCSPLDAAIEISPTAPSCP